MCKCEREAWIGGLLYVPQLGIQPIPRSLLKTEEVVVGAEHLSQPDGEKCPPINGLSTLGTEENHWRETNHLISPPLKEQSTGFVFAATHLGPQ